MYMLEKTAHKWSWSLVSHGAPENDREIYEYALLCLLNEGIIDTVLLLGSVFLGNLKEMVLWILVFDSLRKNIGGFHAKNPRNCEISSIILGFLSVYLGARCQLTQMAVLGITAVSVIMILLLAPVTSENNAISEERRRKARRRGWIFAVFWGCASSLLLDKWKAGAGTCIMGMMFAVLLLTGEWMRRQISKQAVRS